MDTGLPRYVQLLNLTIFGCRIHGYPHPPPFLCTDSVDNWLNNACFLFSTRYSYSFANADCLMRLTDILDNLSLPSDANVPIAQLTLDSRNVQPNDVFIALSGEHHDGKEFIATALERGAAAVLVDGNAAEVTYLQNKPIITYPQLPQALGMIASRYYGAPAEKLRMLGITGTNGKTSCSHYLAQILQAKSQPCGIIGTLGSGFPDQLIDTGFTTPDAVNLQRLLSDFVKAKAAAVAMEVSSHSIDQGRINCIPFETAIFTNLTQDHLDYHHTMDAYAAVKKRYLESFPIKQLVLNADDAYGSEWLRELAPKRDVYAYSLQQSQGAIPTTYACDIQLALNGIQATIHSPWGSGNLSLPLIGRFNLSNALAVLTTLCLYGLAFDEVLAALSVIQPVPGRMQLLGGNGLPVLAVDYSHTPDSLENALKALKAHTEGRLICVFGCGGNRDTSKRPIMAGIAEKWADEIIVTNDNPRHEQPETIADDICRGFSANANYTVLLDRSKAIQKSIQLASANDCVLIAGKGAERYQQIGDEKIPFSDVDEVSHFLEI